MATLAEQIAEYSRACFVENVPRGGIYVPKGWGYEIIHVNTPLYCLKTLFIFHGKRLSWHYHAIKHEHFYCQFGQALLLASDQDALLLDRAGLDMSLVDPQFLTPGSVAEIPTGVRHLVAAIEDTTLLEVSTHHDDADSIRLIPGDQL